MKKLPPLILASKSPRRQELLRAMGLDFRISLKEVDESFPADLRPEEVAVHIAENKARAFDDTLEKDEVVVTADTIVCIDDRILGKPENESEAFEMLSLLSGRMHIVLTGVALLQNHQLYSFYDSTEVYFKGLTESEILDYIRTGNPYDKAGSYGIQEWIGLVAVEKIVGSYNNVMGLPTHKLYSELCRL